MEKELVAILKSAGAARVGFLNRDRAQFGDWFRLWLDHGYHGDMGWMERNLEIRSDPCSILEGGKSIISMAFPYLTPTPEQWRESRLISNYAWGEDYHTVLKKRLTKAVKDIKTLYPEFEGRIFVDSAPLPEKMIAAACGIGWIGRNSMLINPELGSFIFLAEIVCNLDLRTTPAMEDRCGDCDLCIHECPNQAILEDRTINATRCTSYLTIEKRGAYNTEEAGQIRHCLFGCDACQLVCPWNDGIPKQKDSPFACDTKWLNIDIRELRELSESEFEQLKIKSPLKRLKLQGIRRNAAAIINNGFTLENWD
jgi:epoxyqueuosine reductase